MGRDNFRKNRVGEGVFFSIMPFSTLGLFLPDFLQGEENNILY